MNKQEHLLSTLAEEASEVLLELELIKPVARLIQSVSKANRFGLTDGYPDRDTTNAQDMAKEVQELIAVYEMLEDEGCIPTLTDEEKQLIRKTKKERVMLWMGHAKERGALTE